MKKDYTSKFCKVMEKAIKKNKKNDFEKFNDMEEVKE
jgi:aromatic ring-opening dioxygenase catalytic subunit (LigB family)